MKVTLIINPRSGKRQAVTLVKAAQVMAAELGHELEVAAIDRPGHGTILAQEALSSGRERIISIGGDGTLNAIACGLLGSGLPLGIVPMGSGNGYARSLGLPLDPHQALRHAFTGTTRWMDICYLNDIPFLGTAGIGFDARVAAQFDLSHSRGLLGYARIIIREIIGAPAMNVSLTVDGHTERHMVLMLVFCNTREFGNKAVISPGSIPNDGVAELRVVRKPGLLPLMRAFVQIYTGRADRSPYITNIRCTKARVWQEGVLAHLDGEPMEIGHDVRFRLEREQLCVVA